MILGVLCALVLQAQTPDAIDAWLDRRWDAPPASTDGLVRSLTASRLRASDVEKRLRDGRARYEEPPQPRGRLTADVPLDCDHVDHSVNSFVYVPTSYDPKRAVPLVVVLHGGSSGRDLQFGARAALAGTKPFWTDAAERQGWLVVAPLTDRGWGTIGFSILFSAISKMQRDYHVDPDRVYLTGHSMGGHMSWRCGISVPDRWGAVSPMSGGYDYVASGDVHALFNVPGFVTFGRNEPYQINAFNLRIKAWMEERGYPWILHEKPGGHEIFRDEIEPICEFFAGHPRILYPPKVFIRGGGPMIIDTPEDDPRWGRKHAWRKGRAIPVGTAHWIRLLPRPAGTPPEKAVQSVWAVNRGGNVLDITSENVRELQIMLHPAMVDFSKPVRVRANGKSVFDGRVTPSLKTMLETVREFDDRGRIFHAAIDVRISDDRAVPEPTFK